MERKTETLNLRVIPKLTEPVRLAMVRNHRTIANFIEVLVREQRDRLGIGIGLVLTMQPSSR